jgi:NADH-quinone oxidoreductase subunit D
MPTDQIQYKSHPGNLILSEPNKLKVENLRSEEMIINLGPQHPSTHGVLRLEVLMDGEIVKEVVPHIGYLHRCFEKHGENLPYNQVIPFVDRLDYVASMNSEHAYAMGVERMLGIEHQIAESYCLAFYCDWNIWDGHRGLLAFLLAHARSGAYSSITGMGIGGAVVI